MQEEKVFDQNSEKTLYRNLLLALQLEETNLK
jgi:hypothetical protein